MDISGLLPRQITQFPSNAGSQISLFNATLTAVSVGGNLTRTLPIQSGVWWRSDIVNVIWASELVSIRTKQRARTGAAKKGRKRRRGGATEPQPVTAQQLRDLPIDFSAIDRDSLEALASRATLLELERGAHLLNDALSDLSASIFLSPLACQCACPDLNGQEGILNCNGSEPFIHRAFGPENRTRMRVTAMCP